MPEPIDPERESIKARIEQLIESEGVGPKNKQRLSAMRDTVDRIPAHELATWGDSLEQLTGSVDSELQANRALTYARQKGDDKRVRQLTSEVERNRVRTDALNDSVSNLTYSHLSRISDRGQGTQLSDQVMQDLLNEAPDQFYNSYQDLAGTDAQGDYFNQEIGKPSHAINQMLNPLQGVERMGDTSMDKVMGQYDSMIEQAKASGNTELADQLQSQQNIQKAFQTISGHGGIGTPVAKVMDQLIGPENQAQYTAASAVGPSGLWSPTAALQRELFNRPMGQLLLKDQLNPMQAVHSGFMGADDPNNPLQQQVFENIPMFRDGQFGAENVTMPGMPVAGGNAPEVIDELINRPAKQLLLTRMNQMVARDPSLAQDPERYQQTMSQMGELLSNEFMQNQNWREGSIGKVRDELLGQIDQATEDRRFGRQDYRGMDHDQLPPQIQERLSQLSQIEDPGMRQQMENEILRGHDGVDTALAREQLAGTAGLVPSVARDQIRMINEGIPNAARSGVEAVKSRLPGAPRAVQQAVTDQTQSRLRRMAGGALTGLGRAGRVALPGASIWAGYESGKLMAQEHKNRALAAGMTPQQADNVYRATLAQNMVMSEAGAPAVMAALGGAGGGALQMAGSTRPMMAARNAVSNALSRAPSLARFAPEALRTSALPAQAAAARAQGAGRMARGLAGGLGAGVALNAGFNAIDNVADGLMYGMSSDPAKAAEQLRKSQQAQLSRYKDQGFAGRVVSGINDPAGAYSSMWEAQNQGQDAQQNLSSTLADNTMRNLRRYNEGIFSAIGDDADMRQNFGTGNKLKYDEIQGLADWASQNKASGLDVYGKMGKGQQDQFTRMYQDIADGRIPGATVNDLFNIPVDRTAPLEQQAQQALAGMHQAIGQTGADAGQITGQKNPMMNPSGQFWLNRRNEAQGQQPGYSIPHVQGQQAPAPTPEPSNRPPLYPPEPSQQASKPPASPAAPSSPQLAGNTPATPNAPQGGSTPPPRPSPPAARPQVRDQRNQWNWTVPLSQQNAPVGAIG